MNSGNWKGISFLFVMFFVGVLLAGSANAQNRKPKYDRNFNPQTAIKIQATRLGEDSTKLRLRFGPMPLNYGPQSGTINIDNHGNVSATSGNYALNTYKTSEGMFIGEDIAYFPGYIAASVTLR